LEDNTAVVEEELDQEIIEQEAPEVEDVVEEVADDQTEEAEAQEDEITGYDISLGDESLTSEEPEEEPEGIKNLREANRQKKQELKELKMRLQQLETQGNPQEPELPFIDEEPTLEDYEYDQEEYQKAMREHYAAKQKHEQKKLQEQQQILEVQQKVQENYSIFSKSKEAFGHPEMDEIEQDVADALNQVDPRRSLVLLDALKDDEHAAQKVFALGKKKENLQKLSAIQDPVLFGMELANQLSKVNVTPRKGPKTSPERSVKSSGAKGQENSTLKRLEAEALRTGNMNKLLAYERKLKARK
jgi:hypothetical protein